jgi:hypothetical protein
MDAAEFERDLHAWLDGELPAERAARMQAAADASPELAQRVAMERVFHVRVKRALVSDPGSVEIVREMAARARAVRAPAGRLLGVPIVAAKAAAAALVVATAGMWWFCIPPFECAYMQALEAASHDPNAVPGPEADEFAREYRMPREVAGAFPAPPVASTKADFWFWHVKGIRQDYVRAGGQAFQVVVFESPGIKPSERRRHDRDGQSWWIADVAGRRVVAFEKPGDPDEVCAVTGCAHDDSVYEFAKSLRASFR